MACEPLYLDTVPVRNVDNFCCFQLSKSMDLKTVGVMEIKREASRKCTSGILRQGCKLLKEFAWLGQGEVTGENTDWLLTV